MKNTENVIVEFHAEFIEFVDTLGTPKHRLVRVRHHVGHNPDSTILVDLQDVTFIEEENEL